tara:strand:- start:21389 stop:22333 length:945 start_codon:yes stop_codon:yes gene_type:complete
MPKKSRRRNKRKKSRTRKKRGAVKYKKKKTENIMSTPKKTLKTNPERFGKNKSTDDIVKKVREILKTTPQRVKREKREEQIKSIGEQELALFKKQALIEMRINFEQTFGQAPSDRDRKMFSLVYKSLKDPLSKAEEDYIKKYRRDEEENKKKFMWTNNYLRQLKRKMSIKQLEIYKDGDNPENLLKTRTGKKREKDGPATGLEIDTADKDMSPVKGPDTRYPELSKEIGNRGKNLFQKSLQGGRKKKGGRRTRRKRGSNGKKTKKGITKHDRKGLPPPYELVQVDKPDDRFIMAGKRRTKKKTRNKKKTHKKKK